LLAEDDPVELWVARGEQLFYQRRCPNTVSLETFNAVTTLA
jgi:hypothetical protein